MAMLVHCEKCGQSYIQPDLGMSPHHCPAAVMVHSLTEEDVRRIVRKEIERANRPHHDYSGAGF